MRLFFDFDVLIGGFPFFIDFLAEIKEKRGMKRKRKRLVLFLKKNNIYI